MNARGYVSVVDVNCPDNPPNEWGFRYFPTPAKVTAALESSGLAPQAIFCAAVDLLPLNVHGARFYRGKLEAKRAARFDRDAALAREAAAFDALTTAVPLAGRGDGLAEGFDPHADSDAWADDIDARLGWAEPDASAEEPAETLRPVGRVPGTPPHRIRTAAGFTLSKRMVCFWRQHPDYVKAARLIHALCERPLPTRPHEDSWSRAVPVVNQLVEEAARKKLMATERGRELLAKAAEYQAKKKPPVAAGARVSAR